MTFNRWHLRFGSGVGTLDARDRGSQLVEFSIVLPFLLVLTVGIVDFGKGYKTYQNLTNATREGARLSSVRYYNQPTVAPDKVRDRMISYLSTLNLETSFYQGSATSLSGTTAWIYGDYPHGPYLMIDQGKTFPNSDTPGTFYSGSLVQLRYPYSSMFFGQVIRLIAPDATYNNSVFIQNSTLIQNE